MLIAPGPDGQAIDAELRFRRTRTESRVFPANRVNFYTLIEGAFQTPVVIAGPAGPTGPAGPQGEVGPRGPAGSGSGSDAFEEYDFNSAATWSGTHTLGHVPIVATYVGEDLVYGSVEVTDTTFAITFDAPISGKVVLT